MRGWGDESMDTPMSSLWRKEAETAEERKGLGSFIDLSRSIVSASCDLNKKNLTFVGIVGMMNTGRLDLRVQYPRVWKADDDEDRLIFEVLTYICCEDYWVGLAIELSREPDDECKVVGSSSYTYAVRFWIFSFWSRQLLGFPTELFFLSQYISIHAHVPWNSHSYLSRIFCGVADGREEFPGTLVFYRKGVGDIACQWYEVWRS